jgi:hypothetical protein
MATTTASDADAPFFKNFMPIEVALEAVRQSESKR